MVIFWLPLHRLSHGTSCPYIGSVRSGVGKDWGRTKLSAVSSWRTLIPLVQGPTFMTSFNLNYLLNFPSPNIVTLEVRVLTYLGRLQNISSLAVTTLYYHCLQKGKFRNYFGRMTATAKKLSTDCQYKVKQHHILCCAGVLWSHCAAFWAACMTWLLIWEKLLL